MLRKFMGAVVGLVFAGIATALLANTAQAASPINLNCSGKSWNLPFGVYGQRVDALSIIVDFDQMVLRGSLGEFSISGITDSNVYFHHPFEENGKITGKWTGWVDRITGSTTFQVSRDGGKTFIIVYQMTCQPTKPLF